MMTAQEMTQALILLQAAYLPTWDRIALLIRTYAASFDVGDVDWYAKTRTYADALIQREARKPPPGPENLVRC